MQKLAVLRAVDKLDRLGSDGVAALLGPGRRDESGAFTRGAELGAPAIEAVLAFVEAGGGSRASVLDRLSNVIGGSAEGDEGLAELSGIGEALARLGVEDAAASFDPSVVRGLEYYTGAVFEADLQLEGQGEEAVRFGSIGGGGRYDDLVARFTGERTPATGFSFGVSRLAAALAASGAAGAAAARAGGRPGPGSDAHGRIFRPCGRTAGRRPRRRGLSRRFGHAGADEVRRPPPLSGGDHRGRRRDRRRA